MKKILLTGFEPFQSEALNPSAEVVRSFEGSNRIETLILPVSYQRAVEEIRAQIAHEDYDFILMLGQAGGRKGVDLERVALNLQDSERPDEDGDLRLQQSISPEGPAAFMSPLPLRDWSQALQKAGLPVGISFSAGAFVCNTLYYRVCEILKASQKKSDALFVHLPYQEEQLKGKDSATPFLPLPIMRDAVERLIQLIRREG